MSNIITYRMEQDELRHPCLVAEQVVDYTSTIVTTPEQAVDVANHVYNMARLAEEMVCLLSLDSKGEILGIFRVSQGTVNASLCNPREVFIRALVSGASSIIILHNHPSGDSSPSDKDMMVCERLSKVSDMMGVKLSDFIIIGETYYSFRENDNTILGKTA